MKRPLAFISILILFAVAFVAQGMFPQHSLQEIGKLQNEIEKLRAEVDTLKESVDSHTTKIELLQSGHEFDFNRKTL